MQAWVLALIVVSNVNGQEIRRPVVVEGLFSESLCFSRAREIRAGLPRGHRVVDPICLPRGWLT